MANTASPTNSQTLSSAENISSAVAAADKADARRKLTGILDDASSAENTASAVAAADKAAVRRKLAGVLDDDCPICRGKRFVVLDLPLSHPDFGKATPCQCRRTESAHNRAKSLQNMSQLGALQRLTFDGFIAEPSHLPSEKAFNLRRAYDTSRQYAEKPDGWLLLTGVYGCGKTHLAAAIANARLALGQPILFLVVPDLLDHLRSSFGPQSELRYDELFEQVRSIPLLILDDLGTQSSTPWAQEKLFQLLNHRYNAQLPTVITTNQRLEDLEQRLRSRLSDMKLVQQVPIIAPDFRTGSDFGQSDLSTLRFHRDQRFETFDTQRSDLKADERVGLRDVVAHCDAYARGPNGWLALAGTYGCGKTHLAAAIANYQTEHALGDAMFIVVPDLLDHLRAAFSPDANTPYDRRFDQIKNTPMLILDDLGTESATPWAKEKLFQLLNYRYSAMLPTVITTASQLDEIEPRLRTRMFDVSRCKFLVIRAPAYRGNRKPQ